MQIYVQTMTGKTILIDDVDGDTTGAELKRKVHEREGTIPLDQFMIVSHGQPIWDGDRLADLKMNCLNSEAGGCFQLVLRPRGWPEDGVPAVKSAAKT
jgi:Ubiquitin family